MEECALQIDGLGVRYDGRWVLREFSLRLGAGEKIALTGPSGAGKSTVLRCVLGLAMPGEGEVRVRGKKMDGDSVWTLRRELAYVAQEPDLGPGTAREVLGRSFEYKANAALRPNLEKLPGLMERFGLAENLLGKEMTDLSGGEKQRFALISAILLDRPIVLLDEASAALDKANKEAVAEFFRESDGLSVLAVSHDTEWAAFADRVVELPGTPDGNGGGRE